VALILPQEALCVTNAIKLLKKIKENNMPSVNKVMIIGRLGRVPDIKRTAAGQTVANFSVATDEGYTDKSTGQKVQKTEWHRIVLWRGLADVAERYLNKGSLVYIEGKLRTRKWTDQNEVEHRTTEIVGDNMVMLGERRESSSTIACGDGPPTDSCAVVGPNAGMPSAPEDDLPF
jgi:single-strand DNA-binding protein